MTLEQIIALVGVTLTLLSVVGVIWWRIQSMVARVDEKREVDVSKLREQHNREVNSIRQEMNAEFVRYSHIQSLENTVGRMADQLDKVIMYIGSNGKS